MKEPRLSIRSLAPHLIDANGSIMPFDEQISAYAHGEMASGDMFVISEDATSAGIPEAGTMPILMRQRTMRKLQVAHDISLTEIRKLPRWLESHPISLESITEENGLIIVADVLDMHGNDIIVAMHLALRRQQAEIKEIASVYGKKNLAYLIENTAKLRKRVHLNKRTGDWILRTGLQLPEQIANRLQQQYTSHPPMKQRPMDASKGPG